MNLPVSEWSHEDVPGEARYGVDAKVFDLAGYGDRDAHLHERLR